MSEPIARPVFFEGQVLAAADLDATVAHARGEGARDRRYLHTPGIATGLALAGEERETADAPPKKYQEVTLSAGVAIDRTGRQVVLTADTRLDEIAFDEQRVVRPNEPDAWYPVFVRGRDERTAAAPLSAGSCGTSEATRMNEVAEISFGSPGQELDFDANVAPEPADGPGEPDGSLVLVGFVQWDKDLTRFKAVRPNPPGVRHAGVLADEVVARSGSLALRGAAGAGRAAVVIDGENGELRFGPQDAAGDVVPVLTIDAQGNILAKGGNPAAGLQVQSGIAMDGVVLPLPPGVDPQLAAEGKVPLHIHLSPRFPAGPSPDGGNDWVAVPHRCHLEGATRRVRCTFRWFRPNNAATPFEDHPGLCHYTILAAAPAGGGS